MNDADALTPEGIWIGGASGDQADAEAATDRVNLVGDAQYGTRNGLRQRSSGIRGPIMLFDSCRHGGELAANLSIDSAHDALKFRKFSNDLADKVRFA